MMPEITDRTALLIVDVQKGFINENTKIVPSLISSIIPSYENIIATLFFNRPGSPFERLIEWFRFQEDSNDVKLALDIPQNTLVIEKDRYTCVSDKFNNFVQKKLVNEIHICGLDTEVCVTKCAADIFEIGIRPVILSKYCASTAGPAAHDNAILALKRIVGKKQIC